jgi:hypothetical protein
MKKITKIAVLAAGALAVASTSQAASGDLLVGIYSPSVNQTFVLDIGAFSSLANGETWNLDSLSGGKLFGAPTGTGAGGSVIGGAGFTSASLSGARFGVVGYANFGANIYYTAGTGSKADVSSLDGGSWGGAVDGVSQGVFVSGNSFQTDWKTQSSASTGGDVFDALGFYNVNGTQGTHLDLYSATEFGTLASQVKDNFFSLGTDGVLTYGAAVPEPTTYGLLGGAGLLVLSFRNQFRRKQV